MQTPPLDPPRSTLLPPAACCHQRLVDPVLAENGNETGMIRCLECNAIIPDPLSVSVH